MRSLRKSGLCCLLAVLIVLDPNVIQQWMARAQQPAKPAAKEPADKKEAPAKLTPEELKRIADEMERGFKALEAAEKEIPRDTFDPKAIVDKAGKDPVKLFEWVRDNTYWVPYQGALRGPIGVLMDRLGSSCDRSLLLAELLRVAGHKVRLARGELTEAQAKELLPKIRPVPKEPLPRPKAATKNETEALIEKYAKDYQLEGDALRKNLGKSSLQGAKLAEDVAQRVLEQTPLILKAVGAPDEQTAKDQREREAAAQLAALRDHWWVQREEAAGWTDLDPLLPDAQAGSGQAASSETFAPDAKSGTIVLDGKFCHEVQISVVIEQATKDGVKEKTVLSHMLRPSELFGAYVALNHYPMKWPKDLNLLEDKDPRNRLATTVLAQDEWLPILTVGSDRIVQSGFTADGESVAAPLAPLLGAGGQKLGGNIGNILGRGKIGKPPGAKSNPDAMLTAEWIEYDIRVPGRPPNTIRREVFDLLGPGKRTAKEFPRQRLNKDQQLQRGLAVLQNLEILPLVCRLSPDFVSHQFAESFLRNRAVFEALVFPHDMKGLNELMGKAKLQSNRLMDLALVRFELSELRSEIYLDRPNILAFSEQLKTNAKKEPILCREFDIVANEIAVRPGTKLDSFVVRMQQGVLDTNAEALLIKGCGTVRNTAELFALAKGQHHEWSIIRTAEQVASEFPEMTADARRRMVRDLADGYVLFVPKKLPLGHEGSLSWWRVKPKTGDTLGRGERGAGQAVTEEMAMNMFMVGLIFFIMCEAGTAASTDTSGLATVSQRATKLKDTMHDAVPKCFVMAFAASATSLGTFSAGQLMVRGIGLGIAGFKAGGGF